MKHYFTPENALKLTYDKVSLEFQIFPTVKPPAGPLTIRGGGRILVGGEGAIKLQKLGGDRRPCLLGYRNLSALRHLHFYNGSGQIDLRRSVRYRKQLCLFILARVLGCRLFP